MKILIKTLLFTMISFTMALPTLAADSLEMNIPPIIVRDENGVPLAESEAGMIVKDRPYLSFGYQRANSKGQIHFHANEIYPKAFDKAPTGDYKVLVLSRGKAPAIVDWKLPASEPLTVVMKNGSAVTVSIKTAEGAPLPDSAVPRFYPESFDMAAGPEKLTNQSNLPGRFLLAKENSELRWATFPSLGAPLSMIQKSYAVSRRQSEQRCSRAEL